MATLSDLKAQKAQSIPRSALEGGPVSAATMAKIKAELQRQGKLPADKKAWDAKDNPAGWNDITGIRGGNLDLLKTRDFETIVHGPYETAKTWTCCKYANMLLWKYPGAQGVLLRKTYASLITTAVQTYKRVIGKDSPIKAYGGEKPEWFDYPNGSRLWLGGFNDPDKALSGERDFYYINQCEELTLAEWETITSRATGRGSVMPYTRVFGECNPGAPGHWILNRPSVKLLKARHEDNPTLFDDSGTITEQGKKSLAILDNLTGMRYQRGRLGNWVAAEGVVYEGFDRDVHTVAAFKIPPEWRRIRIIDFGFNNPFVCLWAAIDPDGRIFIYREIYLSGVMVSEIARDIRKLSVGETFEATICDHDAEDRATLAAEGIRSVPAWKKVKPGIEAVEKRLKIGGDGRPRLMILRDSIDAAPLTFPLVMPDPDLSEAKKPICTAQEFEFYVWPKDVTGKPNKEEPVKEFDHGMDCLRYLVAYVDGLSKRRGRAY
jgi:hypothetical protein